MEAPEKIYIFENPILDFAKLGVKQSDTDIEYIRTDTFVEKAAKYIANHFLVPGMNNEIKDFVNYMKGE